MTFVMGFISLTLIGLALAITTQACTVNWYAAGGLGCCTVLLGWWGYAHGRGPDIGWND